MNRNDLITVQKTIRPTSAVTTPRIDRRSLLKAGGALGLTGLALGLMPRSVRNASAHQDGGTPPAAVTPIVGPQDDGTNLWHVQVGGMDMENNLDFQGFFPGEITINAGDKIWFDSPMPGLHNAWFGYGAEAPPLLIPDPEMASPAAGEAPTLIFNPDVRLPDAESGRRWRESGQHWSRCVLGSDRSNHRHLFDGRHLRLSLHPPSGGHAGDRDRARGRGRSADGSGWLRRAGPGAARRASGRGHGRNCRVRAGHLRGAGRRHHPLDCCGLGAGEGQARVMAILPKELEIKVGDSVKWIIQSPGEAHNVTFVGSDQTPPEDAIFGAFADGTPKITQNPLTFLPSGTTTFDGTGYMQSGFMGVPQLGLPMEFTGTFTAPGEFIYYCSLHGDAAGGGMAATLRVVE